MSMSVSFIAAYSFSTGTPHADEKVHGDEGNFIEHEHGEHVDGDEKAEYAHRKEGEPKEILLGEGLQFQEANVPVKTMMAERSNMATLMPSTPTV